MSNVGMALMGYKEIPKEEFVFCFVLRHYILTCESDLSSYTIYNSVMVQVP